MADDVQAVNTRSALRQWQIIGVHAVNHRMLFVGSSRSSSEDRDCATVGQASMYRPIRARIANEQTDDVMSYH
jgi:hypothetical protein